MSQFVNLKTPEQKMLFILAQALIDQGRATKSIEELDDGVWIHDEDCGGACDYACGAVYVGLKKDGDGDISVITEIQNSGTLRVELPFTEEDMR